MSQTWDRTFTLSSFKPEAWVLVKRTVYDINRIVWFQMPQPLIEWHHIGGGVDGHAKTVDWYPTGEYDKSAGSIPALLWIAQAGIKPSPPM